MVELADTHDSGSCGITPVRVQVPLPAPKQILLGNLFFYLYTNKKIQSYV